jgi:predicted metal-dependent enzyme (double-stranded beta helix superfamily)
MPELACKRENAQMSYTLEQLASDIKATLKADPSPAGKEKVCGLVSKACLDKEFVAKNLTEEACRPRKVLYEDPELGFCICGHVYGDKAVSAPHDHGYSWAIYGQAEGQTVMTDWKIVKKGEGENPSLVEAVRNYEMNPGDVKFYDVGVVHSPRREQPTKLIRIEGANLDRVVRSKIKAA